MEEVDLSYIKYLFENREIAVRVKDVPEARTVVNHCIASGVDVGEWAKNWASPIPRHVSELLEYPWLFYWDGNDTLTGYKDLPDELLRKVSKLYEFEDYIALISYKHVDVNVDCFFEQ